MRGFGNWNWCLKDRATFIDEAVTSPEFKLLSCGAFPGMVPGNEMVKGEVFEFDDPEVLDDLDKLEGHPRHYLRTPIKVMLGSGKQAEVETYIYQYNDRRLEVVEGGDWRKHTRKPVPVGA